MLPGEDGLALCRRLRADSNLPVIMLTALAKETDRIVGLEMGADDYVVKLFSPRELLARIRAVLRRTGSALGRPTGDGDTLQFEGWRLDLARRELYSPDGVLMSLRRAFANLIDNALKYGQEATVHLALVAPAIEISVGDRGPGIPAPLREQVFVPFFRLEASRSRETGGVGLGLTVARTIIRRHGGDITLHDRPGCGLLVKIVLPLSSDRGAEDE